MLTCIGRTLVALSLLLIVPAAAFGQASITGTVRDTSQAILPGVTVEAASPALIEKVRSVVTDGTGQYRIVDLRPGTYTVTFTLPGFSTIKREGLELTGSATFQVNVEMRVGALEETITVTGETPVVDVQNARTGQTLTDEIIAAIPTARRFQNLHVLVPGVTIPAGSQDVGGSGSGSEPTSFQAHGGNVSDSRLNMNGMMIGDPIVGGGRALYLPSVGTSQEVAVTTSGGLGEAPTAGVVVNIIPKEGGNTFSGMGFATGATEGMAGTNYDDDLKNRGLRAPNKVKNVFDYEGALGGPILRDKLWFFGSMRYQGSAFAIAGMFIDRNANDITKWTYDPDFSRQGEFDQYWLDESLRLTWQATQRNKFTAFYTDMLTCVGCTGNGTPISTREGSGTARHHPNNVGQATWTSPITNRVLLEAGWSVRQLRFGFGAAGTNLDRRLIRVQEQGGLIPGLSYRYPGNGAKSWNATYGARAALTYTSGAHSMKVGYNDSRYVQIPASDNFTDLRYRFNNGVPNQITQLVPTQYEHHAYQGGVYAQDLWTINRLTLGGGIRYDRFTTSFPAAQLGPSRFLRTQLTFPEQSGTKHNDISLRTSAAYDIGGKGTTAIKVSLGKFLLAEDSNRAPLGPVSTSSIGRLATNFNRSWTDVNRNFVPDCDLVSLAAQDLSAAGGDICGAASNQNFGRPVFSSTIDPEVLTGWGVRPYNWEFDLSLQRQIIPRMSATVSYFRRWFGNFIVTDNLATAPEDYTFYTLPVPADPRLPISGSVSGFFDVVPAKFGQVNNYITAADKYGKQTQRWNGVDVSINARLSDVALQGGISTGRESKNLCDLASRLPEALLTANTVQLDSGPTEVAIPRQYCDVSGVFLTQLKLLGTYTVPRIDVQVAATMQSIPGADIQASFVASNAVVAPLLGRNLSGGAANTTVNLLPPQRDYGDRLNQLDVRMAKLFRFGGKRLQASVDVFNLLNRNPVMTHNNSYNPTGAWLTPTQVMPARLIKVSAQFDF
jgi:hypothetical protein